MNRRRELMWTAVIALLLAGALSGCTRDEEKQASQGMDGTEIEAPTTVEPKDRSPVSSPIDDSALSKPGSVDITSADLILDHLGPADHVNNDANNNPAPLKILDDAFKVEEHFEDGSLKRRWFVRLFVTFDRSKPWHQQSADSWVQHGPFEEFYPGGERRLAQGEYVDGKREGTWTYWHPGGAKAKEGDYVAAQLEGEWKYYREDGTLLRVETYHAHRKHGTWKYYDVDGETVVREERYVDGDSR